VLKVLFDYQAFADQEYGGVSRYFYSLAASLAGIPDVHARVYAPVHVNQYLAPDVAGIGVGICVKPRRGVRRAIRSLSSLSFYASAPVFSPDIIHETYYSAGASSFGRYPRVLTVFDMIHERCPESFSPTDPTSSIKASAIKRVDHLFCISQNTKRDLLEILDVPEEKVTVVYLAADPLPDVPVPIRHLTGDMPFLLFVGGRFGYKNFMSTLRALAASQWLRENFRVVCFGGGALTQAEHVLIAELGLASDSVVQFGGSDTLLAALYREAAALIYPSSYEGFGIPPLEAMSVGCPVICSNASSIPEVVGNAGVYFDPADVDAQRVALENVLQASEVRSSLIAEGYIRHKHFSWSRCANETLATYRELV
jgi:glycosyltransferase involved in cell wall biosynthesis